MNTLGIESLGLPALPQPGSHLAEEKLEVGYMFSVVTAKKGGWIESAGIHWALKGQFWTWVWFRECKKPHRDGIGRYSDKLRQEKKSKDVLLKDVLLYFFDNQMAPTILDNQENAPLQRSEFSFKSKQTHLKSGVF